MLAMTCDGFEYLRKAGAAGSAGGILLVAWAFAKFSFGMNRLHLITELAQMSGCQA